MTTFYESIKTGIMLFPFFAVLFTLPIFMGTVIHYKAINFVRIAMNYIFLLYMVCVFALVFLPLPTMEQAAQLHSHNVQWIPFQFIADIVKESPLQLTVLSTYLKAVTNRGVLQVVFNILLTVPFGMFLSYYFEMSKRKVVVATFVLSLAIEITQLTGIYGLFHGSYRLCDIDDLMTNTFGGYIGAVVVSAVRRFLPDLKKFDLRLRKKVKYA